jgi:hypothetical protein
MLTLLVEALLEENLVIHHGVRQTLLLEFLVVFGSQKVSWIQESNVEILGY